MTAVLGAHFHDAAAGEHAAARARPRTGRRYVGKRLVTEARLVDAFIVLLYGAIAVVLDFRYEVFPPDAVFRMANGFYVLYSRHPHLAAIGFVWNPLTSVADMVPLLFKDLWFPLVSRDFAASLATVVAMTGAVHQLRSMLQEMGHNRAVRLVLTALFALNPMILYYSANGMSEALYLFTTLGTARYLRRWIVGRDEIRSLVYAGSMLALCYLAREEGVAVGIASGLVVFAVSANRSKAQAQRIRAGLTDALVYLSPFIASFAAWAFSSLVITGSPFEQFTSQYGNSAQVQEYGSYYHLVKGHYVMRLTHEATAIEAMAPLLPVLIVLAAVFAIRRRSIDVLILLSVFGGGLGFTLLSYLDNTIFPWFRFYILAVPLEVVLAGFILIPKTSPDVSPRGDAPVSPNVRPRSLILSLIAVVVALLALGPSLVTTGAAMNNPKIGIEESAQLGAIFHPSQYRTPVSDNALLPIMPFLERMHLPDGDVLTDDAYDCMATTIMRSANPKIFVITNDADFMKFLADPLTWHVHYLVVPPPGGIYNAILHAYPGVYTDGAGFAKLVHQFPATAICPVLRLYKVVGHTNTP